MDVLACINSFQQTVEASLLQVNTFELYLFNWVAWVGKKGISNKLSRLRLHLDVVGKIQNLDSVSVPHSEYFRQIET
jgi:hypothetical protein